MRLSLGHRIPAALLVALWLTAPILASLHGLEEQHVYCPEHSAFEEQTAAAEAAEPRAQDGERAVRSAASAASDAHASCAFTHLGARDATGVAPGPTVTRAPALPPAPAALPPAPPPATIAVFLIAPKNSPPLSV